MLSRLGLCLMSTRRTPLTLTREWMIGKIASSSAPSETTITPSGWKRASRSSSWAASLLSDISPTFRSPAREAISTSLPEATSSSSAFMPPNMVLTSESSGSAMPNLRAASILACLPTTGLTTPPLRPKSLSRSIQSTRTSIGYLFEKIVLK